MGSSVGGARAPQFAEEGGSRALLPTDPSVLGMDIGCGPDGASVQRADVGTPFVHDRQIKRATLLRGTHCDLRFRCLRKHQPSYDS